MRKREAIQPVSYTERKPIPSSRSQAETRQSIGEKAVGFVGVRERGERTMEYQHTREV